MFYHIFEWLYNNMFIINAQNIRDKNIQLPKSERLQQKEATKRRRGAAVKITRIFAVADSQSDCNNRRKSSNQNYPTL